jgi:hypothetical protein
MSQKLHCRIEKKRNVVAPIFLEYCNCLRINSHIWSTYKTKLEANMTFSWKKSTLIRQEEKPSRKKKWKLCQQKLENIICFSHHSKKVGLVIIIQYSNHLNHYLNTFALIILSMYNLQLLNFYHYCSK